VIVVSVNRVNTPASSRRTDPGSPSADALDLLRSWVATTGTVVIAPVASEPSG